METHNGLGLNKCGRYGIGENMPKAGEMALQGRVPQRIEVRGTSLGLLGWAAIEKCKMGNAKARME